ncbi:MAG: Xaa-Pro peptidase family protein [Parachlamydiales bacterium]|jgi:Xaa-Pro aminopeptidase
MDHLSRTQKLQNTLKSSTEALIIEEPINIFYLTGCDISTGTLYISKHRSTLLVDGRYFESCTGKCSIDVMLIEEGTLPHLIQKDSIASLGLDANTTTVARMEKLKESLPGIAIIPLDAPISALRIIKDEQEIALLRTAAQLGSSGYDHAVSLLKPGITEREVASSLEIYWLQQGGNGLAFAPIIAFGANSALPHHRAGDTVLKENDSILIDIGVVKDKYHSDMTRVKTIGTAPKEWHHIYAIVREAHEQAMKACKAGITAGELDQIARSHITENGYAAYFTHSLGHGVGLEIHENPFIRNKKPQADVILQAGMVITIEPGIYIPGMGGVRLENTVIVNENGCEDITLRNL